MDEVVMKEVTKAHPGGACKGMTVTPFGDVLSLYQQINFGNIHQKANESDNGKISALGVLDERGRKVEFADYKEILSNDDSSLLLLISSTQIGVVEVSPEYFKRGYLSSIDEKGNKLPDCTFRTVIDCALEKKPGMKIVKACFHPYNKYAILILFQSDVFMVYDVRTHESSRHSLPANMQFVSFCCGPDVDWLRFSVFLSNNQGDLYALCPIIPLGTIISLTILEELWNWIDNQREFWIGSDRDPNDKLRLEYVNILEAYLCELFGDIDTILKDASDLKNRDDEFVMAGEGKVSSSNILFKRAVCIADYHVVVQGPLTLQQGKVKDPRGINPNDHSAILDVCAPRVSATSLASGSGGNNSNTAFAEDAAPVIAAVHATGFVELLLFDCVDDRVGYIAPRFECLDTREKVFAFPAPTLLQADTFTAAASFTNTQSNRAGDIDWQLRADPVYAHYFYLLNKTDGSVYILSSSWLKNMLNEVAESVQRAELMAQQASLTWQGEEEFDGHMSNDIFSNSKRGAASTAGNSSSAVKQSAAELSLCLPLFEPPTDNNSTKIQLLSMVVYYDVYLGHVALLLLSSGQLVAINVSVHTKLCALHTHLSQISDEANTARDKSLALLPETLRKDLQEYHVPYRTAQVLLTKIEEGLQKIPTLEVTVESEEDRLRGAPPSAADARKLLASVSAHIETAVLVPLKRLHDNTLFHCDLVRDMAQVQHDLIHGSGTQSNQTFPGIKNLLRNMEDKQHALKERIAKIQERDEYLRDQLQSYLELTCNLPRPLTRAEKVYQRQLHQWLQQVRAMNEEVALLKMKTDKRRFVQHHEQQQHQQPLPTPPQSTTASSAVRGTTPFFKASSASFLSSTSSSSSKLQPQNTSLDVSSVSVLNTPWTASRPTVGTGKQAPMTPPPVSSSSSSTASSSVLFSPSSTQNATSSGMYYYHPEAVRYPPTASFTSPIAVSAGTANVAASVGDTAAPVAVPPINAPVSIPELTAEEISLVHASLEEIGQTLAQARKHVEGTLKDVKHQQRLQQRATNQS